jgi:hypothetical protein
MRADEFHEGHLPAEVEGRHQAIIPSGNLESDALTAQHLGSGRGFPNVVRRHPMRSFDEFVPAFQRDPRFRVRVAKADECIPSDDPHGIAYHVPHLGTSRR